MVHLLPLLNNNNTPPTIGGLVLFVPTLLRDRVVSRTGPSSPLPPWEFYELNPQVHVHMGPPLQS
jgi:hypothetical protein